VSVLVWALGFHLAATPPAKASWPTKTWPESTPEAEGLNRAALDSLPADLEVYSSASDDIAQALSRRIVQGSAQKISGHHGATSVRKLESAR